VFQPIAFEKNAPADFGSVVKSSCHTKRPRTVESAIPTSTNVDRHLSDAPGRNNTRRYFEDQLSFAIFHAPFSFTTSIVPVRFALSASIPSTVSVAPVAVGVSFTILKDVSVSIT